MKTIARIFVFVITLISFNTTFAASKEGWYVGGGLGQSNLGYDLRGKVDKEIKEAQQDADRKLDKEIGKLIDEVNSHGPDYQPVSDFLSQYQNQGYFSNLNIPVMYSEDFKSTAYKVFTGYDFGNRLRVEFGYKNYGRYNAHAGVGGQFQEGVAGADGDYSGEAEVHAHARAEATGKAKASSFGASLLVNALEFEKANVFFRLGAERATASYTTTTTYSYGYGYSYNANLAGDVYQGGDDVVVTKTETKTKRITGYVPVIGAGVEFDVAKDMLIRTEFERTGDPRRDGTKIDMYTINFIKRF